MVLKVETDAWEFDLALHAHFLELLGISNTRALQDEWGAERAAGDDDLFPRADDCLLLLTWMKWLHGDRADSGGAAVLKDDFVNFSVTHKVQITMVPDIHISRDRSIVVVKQTSCSNGYTHGQSPSDGQCLY